MVCSQEHLVRHAGLWYYDTLKVQLVENIIETIDRLRTSLGEIFCTENPDRQDWELDQCCYTESDYAAAALCPRGLLSLPFGGGDDGAGKNLLSLRGLDQARSDKHYQNPPLGDLQRR